MHRYFSLFLSIIFLTATHSLAGYDISQELHECERHFKANRLTTAKGETALSCYKDILKKYPSNAEALAGLKKIEARYIAWAKRALDRRQKDKARQYLAGLRRVNPDSPELAALTEAIDPTPKTSSDKENTESPILAESQLQSSHSTLNFANNTLPAGKIFRDRLQNGSWGPEMVGIPAGRFHMGDIQGSGAIDEQPVHKVSIQSFAMGRYEVTIAEYDKFAKAIKRKKPNYNGWGQDNRPVINISWQEAIAYVKWLSSQTGQKYRLPTEAEWEYAARAKTKTKYWWGNKIGHNRANCNGCGRDNKKTALVGSFAPNRFGLYDTVGNVWEWTCSISKHWEKYRGKEQDCVTDTSPHLIVIRGGSWNNKPIAVRSANRGMLGSSYINIAVGFRLAREKLK